MSSLTNRLAAVRLIVCDVDGVLTDGSIGFDPEGRHFRQFNVRDGLGFALWHIAGGDSVLMSGQGSASLQAVADQWKCTECLMEVRDKESACKELATRYQLRATEIAFLGDDLLDLAAIRYAGVGIAVSDAAKQVREAALVITETRGGKGALREAVETILDAQGRLEETVAAYCKAPPPLQ